MLNLQALNLTINQTPCIHELTMSINNTGTSVILGSNGAGKTLLLKLCAGLLPPSGGTISCRPQLHYPDITFVPSQPVLLDKTVYQNILLPLHCNHIEPAKERALAALSWANIQDLSNTPALNLSIGQQQLVALARAWALQPTLLLLDEPCANLDPNRQQHIETLIRQWANSGCKIIMSSHNIAQAQRLADDIIFMESGRLVTYTAAEYFFQPTPKAPLTPAIAEKIEHFIRYA